MTARMEVPLREPHLKVLAVALDNEHGFVGSMGAFEPRTFQTLVAHKLLKPIAGDLAWDRHTEITHEGRVRITLELARAQRRDPDLFAKLNAYRREHGAWLERRAARRAALAGSAVAR